MTKENSRLFAKSRSCAKLSNLLIASRNDPADRTCSQVNVVKLAVEWVSQVHTQEHELQLTAKRGYRGVDRFNQDALPMNLYHII